MTSVVIPAHDEAAVIGATLAALFASDGADDLDVVVVANGCTDDTAAVARAVDPRVRVIETETAGKARALNRGDASARSFPRVYLDADTVLEPTVIPALVAALAEPEALAAAPVLRLDTSVSSWAVRAYLSVWQELPQVRDSLAGRGVYALSETGHDRLGTFPDVLNDDGYVDRLFADGTARTVATATSTVVAPRTLRQLVRRRTRVVAGNTQLRQFRFPAPLRARSRRPGWLQVPREHPRLALALAVFLPVSVLVRLRAAARRRRGRHREWSG